MRRLTGGSIGLQFPFTNNGTISANNGTIELYGVIDWNAVSSMSFTNANLKIAGQLDNTGKTLNVQENGPTSFFPASIRSSMRSTHCRRTSATSASWTDGRSRPPAIYSTPAPFSVDDQSLLTVAGALSLEDTSVLDLTLGAGHGTLIDVQGSASLAGQLQIELANGFVPASGDQFAFMTAGSYVGNFTSFDLPSLPDSETWDTSQAPAGIISVTLEPSMLGIGGLLWASLLLRRKPQELC